MRIGELAEILHSDVEKRTGVRVHENASLLEQPVRPPNGHRDDDEALARLVRAGQVIGLTVAELETLASLRADGRAPCGEVREILRGHLRVIDERTRTLLAIRREVATLVHRADALDPAECDPATVFHLTNPAACPCTVHATEAPSLPGRMRAGTAS